MKYISTLALGVVFALGSAQAQTVGSLDDMKDVCEVSPSSQESRLIDATAFLVRTNRLSQNPDGTYNVWNEPYTEVPNLGGGLSPICSWSRFYGEPTARLGRTGVLIGRDTILTAPHANPFNPQSFAIVFRDKVGTAPCVGFQWSNIPAANVYFPDSSSTTSNTYDLNGDRYDFATFKLDRIVLDRDPIKVRRSGQPDVNDLIVLASYPVHTAMKFDVAGIYLGTDQDGDPLFYNLHPFAGSSGGALYNLKDGVIETIIASGLNGGGSYSTVDSCVYYVHSSSWTNSTGKRTNGQIADVADIIPRDEILVTPLDRIVHVADVGGTLSTAVSSYQITSSTVSDQFAVSSVGGDVYFGSPTLTSNLSPGTYTIGSSGVEDLTLTAGISSVTHCGIWNLDVVVSDVSLNQDNLIRHRFEIGAKEIAVSDDPALSIKRFYPPTGTIKTFQIDNIRPTAVTLNLPSVPVGHSDSTPFRYSVKGAPVTSITLGPVGSRSASATIDVSVDGASALEFPLGLQMDWNFVIAIDDFVCALTEDVVSQYSYINGRQDFEGFSDGDLFPPGNPSGPEFGEPNIVNVEVEGAPSACVSEVELQVDFLQGFMAGDIRDEIEYLKIDLVAPNGITANLWDRNVAPEPTASNPAMYFSYGHEVDYPGVTTYPAQRLRLSDAFATPAGADLLAKFSGTTQIDGTWTLEIRAAHGLQYTVPMRATLDIKRSPPFGGCEISQ